MDVYALPWLLVTINATIWTLLVEHSDEASKFSIHNVEVHINLLVSACLAFLLVFRLNRVAIRWWDTRRNWGVVVEQVRTIVSEILEHVHHAPELRDDAVRWCGGYLIAIKQFLRGERCIDPIELAGFLSREQIQCIQDSHHPGLYCTSEIRHALKIALSINDNDDEHNMHHQAYQFSSSLQRLEIALHQLIAQVGGMERVKATPLPIVYVTHLRTFLILYLLLLPYVFAGEWGFYTILVVSLVAFALLGIDGAAHECEVPFSKGRVNHLDMEAFCIMAMDNITQLVCHSADMYDRDYKVGIRNGEEVEDDVSSVMEKV